MSDALSILIVDDDPSNLDYLSALVEALGYTAETAPSGRAALERLAQPPRPDLVVVDVIMPELDGVETLRRYRGGGGKAPVIMCSALDEADTVVRAMRAGATDYITKPFNPDELREILDRAAGQSGKAQEVATPQRGERNKLGDAPSMRAIDDLIDPERAWIPKTGADGQPISARSVSNWCGAWPNCCLSWLSCEEAQPASAGRAWSNGGFRVGFTG